MLMIDRDWIWPGDLVSEEPDIEEDAEALTITLAGNTGLIRRGMEEMTRVVENWLVSFTTYISSNDMSANHLAAVFYTGSIPNQRRRITTDQIVISGRNNAYWSEIKQWGVNYMLMRFYISAANRSKDDRYTNKRNYYKDRDVLEMRPSLWQSGIPIVYRPMPAPDATNLRNPGTWLAGPVAGAGTVTGNYDVAISYTDSSRFVSEGNKNNQNGEGQTSRVQEVALTPGNVIQVNVTNLNTPNASVSLPDIARGFIVPLNADGYNVWVGLHGQPLYLQNVSGPIRLTQNLTYALPGDPQITSFGTVNPAQYPLSSDLLVAQYPWGQGQYVEAFASINPYLRKRS